MGSTRERENGAARTGGGAHGRMRDVYADVRAGMVRKIDAAGAAVSAAQVETVVFRAGSAGSKEQSRVSAPGRKVAPVGAAHHQDHGRVRRCPPGLAAQAAAPASACAASRRPLRSGSLRSEGAPSRRASSRPNGPCGIDAWGRRATGGSAQLAMNKGAARRLVDCRRELGRRIGALEMDERHSELRAAHLQARTCCSRRRGDIPDPGRGSGRRDVAPEGGCACMDAGCDRCAVRHTAQRVARGEQHTVGICCVTREVRSQRRAAGRRCRAAPALSDSVLQRADRRARGRQPDRRRPANPSGFVGGQGGDRPRQEEERGGGAAESAHAMRLVVRERGVGEGRGELVDRRIGVNFEPVVPVEPVQRADRA